MSLETQWKTIWKHGRERNPCLSNISKTSASVSSGFQTRENWWKHEAAFYRFRVFETPMKHEARVFEITSPTKEN